MKAPVLLTCLLLLVAISFAGTQAKEKPKKENPAFSHHTGEFHITPFATYLIYKPDKKFPIQNPYSGYYPGGGMDIGGRYTFRFIRFMGISTGLNAGIYSSHYYGKQSGFDTPVYGYKRDDGFGIYATLPLQIHFYKQMRRSTFEFSTGPDFNFSIYGYSKNQGFDEQHQKTSSTVYSRVAFYPFLGWNILLGAQIDLTPKANLFIGPQVNFFEIAHYSPYGQTSYLPVSLGLKLGFRFNCKSNNK